MYVDASGNPSVYGVVPPPLGQVLGSPGYFYADSAIFFLIGRDPQSGGWGVLAQTTAGAMGTSAPLQLRMLGGDVYPTVLWMDQQGVAWQELDLASSGGAQMGWVGSANRLPFGDIAPEGVSRILSIPGDVAPHSILFIDNDSNLHLASFSTDLSNLALEQLTGEDAEPAGAPAGAVAVCLSGSSQLFIIETGTGALWTCKQFTETAYWVPLGNRLAAVAAKPDVSGGPELFIADLNYRVFHLSQNPSDTLWVTQRLAIPSPAANPSPPAEIASITMQAAAVDAQGNPVPDAIFTLSSDQWVSVVVQSETHWVGPGAPALFAADATGTASAMYQAHGLVMPQLTFSAISPGQDPSDGAAGRWCQGDAVEVKPGETAPPPKSSSIANRLAGNDPGFAVTDASLVAAGLATSGSDSDGSKVNMIHAVGQWMQQGSSGAGLSSGPAMASVPRWRVDFTESGPQFRELTETEAGAIFGGTGAKLSGAPEGVFGDIGDLINHFKHAWQDVTSLAATIVGDTIQIAVNGITLVVNTVRQAAAVMELVFVRLANGVRDVYSAIEAVIEWLKLLFEWEDIVNTHKVIKTVVNSLFDTAQASAADLQSLLNQQFSSLQATINGELSKIGGNPAYTQSFNQFANGLPGQPSAASANARQFQGARRLQPSHAAVPVRVQPCAGRQPVRRARREPGAHGHLGHHCGGRERLERRPVQHALGTVQRLRVRQPRRLRPAARFRDRRAGNGAARTAGPRTRRS